MPPFSNISNLPSTQIRSHTTLSLLNSSLTADIQTIPVCEPIHSLSAQASLKKKMLSAAHFFSSSACQLKLEWNVGKENPDSSFRRLAVAVINTKTNKLVYCHPLSISIWDPPPGHIFVGRRFSETAIEIIWVKQNKIPKNYSKKLADEVHRALAKTSERNAPNNRVDKPAIYAASSPAKTARTIFLPFTSLFQKKLSARQCQADKQEVFAQNFPLQRKDRTTRHRISVDPQKDTFIGFTPPLLNIPANFAVVGKTLPSNLVQLKLVQKNKIPKNFLEETAEKTYYDLQQNSHNLIRQQAKERRALALKNNPHIQEEDKLFL